MSTPRPRPRIMTLTDAAADRVRQLMAQRPDAAGLRVGIKKGGCAGMEYTLTWAETQGKFDEVVEDKGIKVLVDPAAIMYLLGTEMDWKVDALSSQFVFRNPNQTSACGCGESVELKPVGKSELDPVEA